MEDREKGRTNDAQQHLPVLYKEIELRCQAVAATRPNWPCRQGCDHCCRSLSEAPRLVRAEWRRLEAGLARLDETTHARVLKRLDAVARQASGPVICPFLDRRAGACRVYEERPAVCRTYGFYQSRDGGRFCQLVAEHTNDDRLRAERPSPWESDLVWGSQDAIDHEIEQRCGPVISLQSWLAEHLPPGTTS